MDGLCLFCDFPLKKSGRKYCSLECSGFAKRGRARGNPYQIAKNHTRISLGKDSNGKTRRVYLHRHIVETCLRPLKEGEVIHHKDENKFNNDISNLEILSSQSEHRKKHNQLDRDRVFDYEPQGFEVDAQTGMTYYF